MSLIIPNLRTGNAAQPVYGVGATERTIANMANLSVWLKANDGYFDAGKTKWYDANTATPYAITGTLSNTGAINGNPAAVFADSQSVDLGATFPTNSDYTLFAVMNPTAFPHTGTVIGGKATSWRGWYFAAVAGGNANMGVAHASSTQGDGTHVYVPNTPLLIALTFDNGTKLAKMYSGGVLQFTTPALPANTDATAVLGSLPGLDAGRKLSALVAETMIFARDTSKLLSGQATNDFTTVTNWLKSKYGL